MGNWRKKSKAPDSKCPKKSFKHFNFLYQKPEDLCLTDLCCGCRPTCVARSVCEQLKIFTRKRSEENENEFIEIGIKPEAKLETEAKPETQLQNNQRWYRYAPYGKSYLFLQDLLQVLPQKLRFALFLYFFCYL